MKTGTGAGQWVRRHLNKLRWLTLITVFLMLLALPYIAVYQNFVAAHAYDLLAPGEKRLYDSVEALTRPLVTHPAEDLGAIKGSTWSGNIFGYKISDPLAVFGQVAAGREIHWPFVATALIPVVTTVLLGRFFCGWICPATLLYELNTNIAAWLRRLGWRLPNRRFNPGLKYAVLLACIVISMLSGFMLLAAIYPPAIIGREIYYAVALGGFGFGMVFFLLTLLFDLLVTRRGFCRYLCPGGALYSLLGRYRVLRINRLPEACNDCAKCTAVCEFALDPMRDGFGQECNNCTACMAVCPNDALRFTINIKDQPYQGPGHLGKNYQNIESNHVSR